MLALREAKQVALRSARVPFGATRLLARDQANDEGNTPQVRSLAGNSTFTGTNEMILLIAILVLHNSPASASAQVHLMSTKEPISICSEIVYQRFVGVQKIVKVDSQKLSSTEAHTISDLLEASGFFYLPEEITSPPFNGCCDRGFPWFRIAVERGKLRHTVTINTQGVLPSEKVQPLLKWLEARAVPRGRDESTNEECPKLITTDETRAINPELRRIPKEIVQKVIDYPALQQYFHPELPGRVPLFLAGDLLARNLDLLKFGEPVGVYTTPKTGTDPVLEFTGYQYDAGEATVKFTYSIEGIAGRFTFTQGADGKWTLIDAKITEH